MKNQIIILTFLIFIFNSCSIFEIQNRSSFFKEKITPLINNVNKDDISQMFGKPHNITCNHENEEWHYWYEEDQMNTNKDTEIYDEDNSELENKFYDYVTLYFDSTDTLRNVDVTITSVKFF